MLKNKIYKYFTIEIIKSFIVILFAFTAIAWTVRAVNFLDLIVENGHSIKTYLLFSLLNVTGIITKLIPLSFLLSLVLSILKFERQNEFIILWTTGVNKIQLVKLFFFVSILAVFFQILFSTFITPASLNKSREIIRSSDFGSLSSVIKTNDFSDSFKDLTMYIGNKNSNNEMSNIFIRDEGSFLKGLVAGNEKTINTTIIAKTGLIDNKKLILIDGLIQTQDKNGKLNNVSFKKTQINVDELKPRSIVAPKLQETTTFELASCVGSAGSIDKYAMRPKSKNLNFIEFCSEEVIATMSRRIGMPFYIPLVSLVCCFLLIKKRQRKFKFLRNYSYFAFGFIILVLAEILVRYSGLSQLNTVLYFIMPLILTPIMYLILLRSLAYERVK